MNKSIILVAVIVIFAAVSVGVYVKYYTGSTDIVPIASQTTQTESTDVKNNENNEQIEAQASSTNQVDSKNLVVKELQQEWAANFGDPKVLVGSSQNVFVAKILRQVGNETKLAWMPQTQFEAEVISNIKGNVQGKVIVSQVGGFYNGVLLVANGDLLGPANSPSAGRLLQIGSTYLLPTRYIPSFSPYYGISSFPGTITLMSDDQNLTTLQLKTPAENNTKYKQLLGAYPNEMLLSADIKNGYTQNSFQSLSSSQKEAVYERINSYIPKTNPTSTTSST